MSWLVSTHRLWLLVAIVAAVAMEPWAALLHRALWHRGMWRVHRSHHRPHGGFFELNDWLSLGHAPIAMALIIGGDLAPHGFAREVAFGTGIGMTVFGAAYVLMHDGYIHGRFPARWLSRFVFARRIREAHRAHHGPGGGPPFGLFLGEAELARSRRRRGAGFAAGSGSP